MGRCYPHTCRASVGGSWSQDGSGSSVWQRSRGLCAVCEGLIGADVDGWEHVVVLGLDRSDWMSMGGCGRRP
jgi:hypothetical protein